ncbi:MAG: hypothetical protein SGCHY_001904 [Lobulomycetales sp.]
MVFSGHLLPSTDGICTNQFIWAALQTVVSAGICFGVNFAIAKSLFVRSPPTLWDFPMPLAGQYGVTLIVQGIINWLLIGSLLTLDVIGKGLLKIPSLNAATFLSQGKFVSWANLRFWINPTSLVISKRSPLSRLGAALLSSTFWILYSASGEAKNTLTAFQKYWLD